MGSTSVGYFPREAVEPEVVRGVSASRRQVITVETRALCEDGSNLVVYPVREGATWDYRERARIDFEYDPVYEILELGKPVGLPYAIATILQACLRLMLLGHARTLS